jgi:hypothetical protein
MSYFLRRSQAIAATTKPSATTANSTISQFGAHCTLVTESISTSYRAAHEKARMKGLVCRGRIATFSVFRLRPGKFWESATSDENGSKAPAASRPI